MENINKEIITLALSSSVVGGVIVAFLNYVFNNKLKNRESQLKIIDKIVDKKIIAYDKIIDFACITRQVEVYEEDVNLNINFNEVDYPLRYVHALSNRNIYNTYRELFFETQQNYSRWVDIITIRELNFIQDYLVNLDIIIKNVEDEKVLKIIGIVIKQDFIDISSILEKLCFKFYNYRITKLKLDNQSKWHKYPISTTRDRLNDTKLLKYKDKIESIIKSDK